MRQRGLEQGNKWWRSNSEIGVSLTRLVCTDFLGLNSLWLVIRQVWGGFLSHGRVMTSFREEGRRGAQSDLLASVIFPNCFSFRYSIFGGSMSCTPPPVLVLHLSWEWACAKLWWQNNKVVDGQTGQVESAESLSSSCSCSWRGNTAGESPPN